MGPLILALLVAAVADAEVERGVSLYRQLEYDRAVVVLGRALVRSDLPSEDRAKALETLAFAYTILEDAVHATETFHQLLDLEPDYRPGGSISPRLVGAFQRARVSWFDGRKVRFEIGPDTTVIRGRLEGGDVRRIGSVIARDEDGRTQRLDCEGTKCRGARPAARFFVDVRDHQERVLQTSGPFDPAPPPEAGGTPWWLWAGIAVVVLGGSLAIAFGGQREPPEGTLGSLPLP